MFLLGVGDQLSADLLRLLDPDEIRTITAEISALDAVLPEHMLGVFHEFESLTVNGRYFAKGGAEFARKLVEQALGPGSAQKLLDSSLAPQNTAKPELDFLADSDPRRVAQFLKSENPQTIALILSNVSPEQAGALMPLLPEDVQPQVALRMASLDRVSPDVMQRISEALGTRLRATRQLSRSDGIRCLAGLLNRVDPATAETILSRVDAVNQAVAASIREQMFVFEDVLTIDGEGMKALVGRLDRKVLTTALKGTSAEILAHFTKRMSQRASEMLKEDMEALGAVRIRDVRAAQHQIVAQVRQLRQEGVISASSGGGDEYVV